MQAQSLGRGRSYGEGKGQTYSSIPAKTIPLMEEPGGLQSMGYIATCASEGKFFISSSLDEENRFQQRYTAPRCYYQLITFFQENSKAAPRFENHKIINSQVTGKQKTSVKLYSSEQSETKSRTWELGSVILQCCQCCGERKQHAGGARRQSRQNNKTRCEGEEIPDRWKEITSLGAPARPGMLAPDKA